MNFKLPTKLVIIIGKYYKNQKNKSMRKFTESTKAPPQKETPLESQLYAILFWTQYKIIDSSNVASSDLTVTVLISIDNWTAVIIENEIVKGGNVGGCN